MKKQYKYSYKLKFSAKTMNVHKSINLFNDLTLNV